MYKRIFVAAIAAYSVLSLSGCASIVTGTKQSVSVATTPVNGANCALVNSKGTWYVPRTPGSVVVHRSLSNLEVTCRKQGHPVGAKTVKAMPKAMVLGNAVFGGLIGAGVDAADGAAFEYPQHILVPMTGAHHHHAQAKAHAHGKVTHHKKL